MSTPELQRKRLRDLILAGALCVLAGWAIPWLAGCATMDKVRDSSVRLFQKRYNIAQYEAAALACAS